MIGVEDDEAGTVDIDDVASDACGDSVVGVSAVGDAYSDERESVEVAAVAYDEAVTVGD